MVFGLLNKIDNSLIYVANKSVKSWNWVTGGNKEDLSNFLLNVAPILESTGFVLSDVENLYFVPIFFISSYLTKKDNKSYINKEKILAEEGLKINPRDMDVRRNKFLGKTFFVFGTGLSLINFTSSKEDYGVAIAGVGNFLRGLSHYSIMADNTSRRKNVLSRSKDKLVEKLKDFSFFPELEPVRIPIEYSKKISNYF